MSCVWVIQIQLQGISVHGSLYQLRKEINMPTEIKIYLCGGNPKCFGGFMCGLCGRGECYATTDIKYARNRYLLLNGGNEYGRLIEKATMTRVKEQ